MDHIPAPVDGRKPRLALFPGSFNPFTIGHADIVERALQIFDRVCIAVGYNENKPNAAMEAFTNTNRIAKIYENDDRVEVAGYGSLTVDFCKRIGACAMIRGVRNAADFDYEKNLADVNLEIAGITTVFIPCRPGLAFVSSSMVRELQHFGHDVSRFIAKKKE